MQPKKLIQHICLDLNEDYQNIKKIYLNNKRDIKQKILIAINGNNNQIYNFINTILQLLDDKIFFLKNKKNQIINIEHDNYQCIEIKQKNISNFLNKKYKYKEKEIIMFPKKNLNPKEYNSNLYSIFKLKFHNHQIINKLINNINMINIE